MGDARVELSRLQKDPRYMARAREVAQRLSQENGSAAACDAIERVLQRKAP